MIRLVRAHPLIVVVPAVLLFFFLALDSLVLDSPTMDEQNHLARGLAFLRTGDPRLSLEHPPLINSLSALPVLMLPNLRLPFDHPSWEQHEGWYEFADQMMWVYNHDVERMIFLARLPIVFLALVLALVGFHFALEMWGRLAGLFAFIVILFDPNLLAHGRYTTTDLGGAMFLTLAALLLWRLWSSESWLWLRLMLAGVGLGLAFGSKLSNLAFVPIFALLAVLPLYGKRWAWRPAGRRVIQYGLAGLIALLTVWALYGFEWGQPIFDSVPLNALNESRIPMPTFWSGIGRILEISGGGRPSFLLGQFSSEGFWLYFPVAFAVKTPILVLLGFLVAAVILANNRMTRPRAIYLLLPAVGYFLVSMSSSLNIGYRHLLPVLPFLYVLLSGLTVEAEESQTTFWSRRNLSRAALVGSVVAVIASTLLIHPHYLSYFNLAAGGPANGHKILIDSNIDWGQDLVRLKRWMDDNNVDQVKLAWFGTADPAYYGIDYEPLPGLTHHFDLWWDLPFDPDNPAPGIYAISVSNLWELLLDEKRVFPWFRSREPDDRVGYSILIYEVR